MLIYYELNREYKENQERGSSQKQNHFNHNLSVTHHTFWCFSLFFSPFNWFWFGIYLEGGNLTDILMFPYQHLRVCLTTLYKYAFFEYDNTSCATSKRSSLNPTCTNLVFNSLITNYIWSLTCSENLKEILWVHDMRMSWAEVYHRRSYDDHTNNASIYSQFLFRWVYILSMSMKNPIVCSSSASTLHRVRLSELK